MRILFLSRWFPYPPNNGSKIRIFNILKQLSRSHDVTLLAFAESTDRVDAETVGALRKYCSEVRTFEYRPFRPSSRTALLALLSPQPRYLADTYSRDMSQSIADVCAKKRINLLVASQLETAPYAMELSDIPAVLEEIELSTYLDAAGERGSLTRRGRSSLTWLKLSSYLGRVLPRFSCCTVASEQERKNLRLAVPGYDRVHIIPNAVDFPSYQEDFGPPIQNQLVFCGAMTYCANYDAVQHFLSDIHPRVLGKAPNVSFMATGDNGSVELGSLSRIKGVHFTGYLPDVRPVVARSWASVVPIRIGGGTRLKILESMALGTPVISTAKGAEGLDVEDGCNILLADAPSDFASSVVNLLDSSALRERLACEGRQLVRRRYDWSVVGEQLTSVMENATAQ